MNFIIQQMSVRTDWNGDVDLLFQSLLDSNIFMLFVKRFSYSPVIEQGKPILIDLCLIAGRHDSFLV